MPDVAERAGGEKETLGPEGDGTEREVHQLELVRRGEPAHHQRRAEVARQPIEHRRFSRDVRARAEKNSGTDRRFRANASARRTVIRFYGVALSAER